jgi:hypothetical protein
LFYSIFTFGFGFGLDCAGADVFFSVFFVSFVCVFGFVLSFGFTGAEAGFLVSAVFGLASFF